MKLEQNNISPWQPHSQSLDGSIHHKDQNQQFYEQYRKIFASSHNIYIQMKLLEICRDQLWSKLKDSQKRAEEEFKDKMRLCTKQRKKRFRRTADHIQKLHVCQIQKCLRSYGSEGSLLQHIKLKHPEKYSPASKTSKKSHESQQKNQEQEYKLDL